MSNAAVQNSGNSATGGFLTWLNENIWLVVADLVGITLFVAIFGSIVLDQWLMLLPALLSIIVGIASLAPAKDDVVKTIKPMARKVSDIRIVITPRDKHGYTIAA